MSSINSVNSYDSDDQYTSEEDNPNDRSGLLSYAAGNKNKNKKMRKQAVQKKNQWVDNQPDSNSRKRKLFRNTGNLSLVLPRLKNRMKRSKIIRKKKRPANLQISSGSPYEEYLPARFKDYNGDDLSPRNGIQKANKNERSRIELPAAYIVSPSVPVSSKPPKSGRSSGKALNFYSKSSAKVKSRPKFDPVEEIGPASGQVSPRMEALNEENEDSLSNNQDLNMIDHNNVLFQRNHKVKPHPEDRSQKPLKELLFAMNADFHKNNENMTLSQSNSKDGSRANSKGRTFSTEKGVFTTIRLQ